MPYIRLYSNIVKEVVHRDRAVVRQLLGVLDQLREYPRRFESIVVKPVARYAGDAFNPGAESLLLRCGLHEEVEEGADIFVFAVELLQALGVESQHGAFDEVPSAFGERGGHAAEVRRGSGIVADLAVIG